MSLPMPSIALTDTCTTIYNNTLYSYSQSGFQSLSLTQGAQWNELDGGVAVSGAACVQATPTDGSSPDAFYILGGSASDSSFQGFQRYNFATDSWETLTPQTAVMQNRLHHSAVYINDSSTILMYAGSQDGDDGPSTQTFSISLVAPYNVLAFESSGAPPAVQPILLPWSSSQAVMLGGSETNTDVMLFDPSNGWVNSSATLAAPLASDITHAVLVQGDDGSKNLLTIDASVSPNAVNRMILVDAYGYAVAGSSPVAARSVDLDERAPTEEYWPAYNSTLAPTTTRDNYAVSMDSEGMVVISGGNTEDPLCVFDAYSNSWMNATSMLVSTKTKSSTLGGGPASIASSVAATPTSTSVSVASSTVAAAAAATTTSADSSTTSYSTKVLGAVLSSVFGAIVLAIVAFLLIKWRKKRQQQATAAARLEENPFEKIDPDRKEPFVLEEPYRPRHMPQESQNSVSSMAILMNNIGGQGHKRGLTVTRTADEKRGSFKQKFKAAISNPIVQERTVTPDSFMREKATNNNLQPPSSKPPGPHVQGTRRSSGWNKYWSGGTTMNMLGFGGSKRSTYASESNVSQSQYADTRAPSMADRPSLHVSPLQFEKPGFVSSGSPRVSHAPTQFPLSEGMSGTIERPSSSSTTSSFGNRHDEFSSGIPESVDDRSWTPIAGQAWGGNGGDSRVASSTYSQSQYVPSTIPTGAAAQLHDYPAPPRPRGDSTNIEGHTSDMSWLNLGAESSRF